MMLARSISRVYEKSLHATMPGYDSPPIEVDSGSDDDVASAATTSSGRSDKAIGPKILDLDQPRPSDESPSSLKEANKLCDFIPDKTAQQESVGLNIFTKVAAAYDIELPSPFQFPHFGLKGYETAQALCETSKTMFDQSVQFSFQLTEFNTGLQKMVDSYNKRVAKPADSRFKEANLWNALQSIKEIATIKEGKSKKVAADIDQG